MSNLSELLPAGAGAKSADFVASGTLGSGVTVALKADGTVEVVAFNSTSAGTAVSVATSGNSNGNTVAVYDPVNNKVVILYSGPASTYYATARVGTVSGSSISFGTAVVLASESFAYPSVCYDAQSQKIVVVYKGSTGLRSSVLTVSGSSISTGISAGIKSGSGAADFFYNAVTYDSGNQKVVTIWRDTSTTNYATYAAIGTVSGTSISFSTPQAVDTTGQNQGCGITYSQEEAVVLMSWVDDYRATVRAATSNGSTLTFGSAVELSATNANSPSWPVYDPISGKMLVMWRTLSGNITYFQTVGVSGTTLTPDSIVTQLSDTYGAYYKMEINSVNNKIYAVLVSATSPQDAILYEITISGSTPTLDSGFVYVLDSSPTLPYYNTMTIDTSSNKVVTAYAPGSSSSALESKVIQPAGSNNTSFIGITDQAIANTATGAVIVQGGVASGITLPYYYSFGTGVVFDTANYTDYLSAVYDPSAQKVVYFYPDFNNSAYGTAVVGTVSGSSISFGTPVVFESANTSWIASTYDSASSKVVVAYSDAGNSDYATAVVGTVSGTSISFGTPVVFQTSRPNYTTATFDSSNNKVVIAYQDNLNSNYGTVVVGTVSGTSISFGTPAVFNAGTTYYLALTFDSNANKVVLAYRDGNNGNAGTARVGTVSGSSISFGSAAVFQSLSSNYMAATFDSNSNKVFIYYYRTGSSDGVVGTVSGTSISFGTPVSFGTTQTSLASATFDSNLNKVFVAYKDNGNSNYGTVVNGTISGTTVTFGDNTVFAAVNAANSPNIVFDSATNKTVIGYTNTAVTGSGTSIVTDFTNTLVTSSDYYVQADGSLSTTVSSVPAGRALSSTSILLEG